MSFHQLLPQSTFVFVTVIEKMCGQYLCEPDWNAKTLSEVWRKHWEKCIRYISKILLDFSMNLALVFSV